MSRKGSESLALSANILLSIGATLAALDIVAHDQNLLNMITDRHINHMLADVRMNPVGAFVVHVGIMPTLEETMFRLLPSLLATKMGNSPGANIALGIASSAAFAAFHDFNLNSGTMHWEEIIKYRNLALFGMGSVFWTLQRTGGYKHAVASHTAMNATVFAAAAHWY